MKKIIVATILCLCVHTLFGQQIGVVISEIMYDSPLNERIATGQPYSNGEYIELYNVEDGDICLEGWRLDGGGKTESYYFGNDDHIPAHGYYTIAYRHYDTPYFTLDSLYHNLRVNNYVDKTFYQRNLILSNSGESLRLVDDEGFVHDSIYYDGNSNKTNPYRLSADNLDGTEGMQCVSLQRINIHFDENKLAIPTASDWVTAKVTPYGLNDQWEYSNVSFADGNHLKVKIFTEEKGLKSMDKTQFYDGLGYLEQEIQYGAAQQHRNLISMYEYDLSNRKTRNWLPITTDRINHLSPNLFKNKAKDDYKDNAPYSEIIYDCGCSNDSKVQYNYGKIFREKDKKTTIISGAQITDEKIKFFYLSQTDTVIHRVGYWSKCLYKESIKNEDNVETINYYDENKRLVLSRTFPNSEGPSDIYYVYDASDRIRMVIPPVASDLISELSVVLYPSMEFVKKYCCYYQYDKYGNIYLKQQPGKEYEYYIYGGDNLCFWQDGNLRKSNRWIRYIYDKQNRLQEQQIVEGIQAASELLAWVNVALYSGIPDKRILYSLHSVHIINQTRYNQAKYPMDINSEAIGVTECEEFPIPEYLHFKQCSLLPLTDTAVSLWGTKKYEKWVVITDTITSSYVERAFYYDKKGNIIQMVEKNHLGGINRTSYTYDFLGKINGTNEEIQTDLNSNSDTKLTSYFYDGYGRLADESTSVNGVQSRIEYGYDDLGRLSSKRYGQIMSEQYTYNNQGWETSRKSDLLDLRLKYYDSEKGANSSFSGNITEWQWQHSDLGSMKYNKNAYTFDYDGLSRLTDSKHFVNDTLRENMREYGITYDNNGNIKTLIRVDSDNSHSWIYTYDANRLMTINNSDIYKYDTNGNTIYDGKMHCDIAYNYMDLVKKVTCNDLIMMEYSYLADGTKLSAKRGNGDGFEYLGSSVYKRTGKTATLESTTFGGGRYVATESGIIPYYFLTDHLGSVRVIMDEYGQVRERNDYYAFGKKWMAADNPISSDNRYYYNGKEQQIAGDLNWLDYGARMYDPEIARWLVSDPMAEQYAATSPYAYVRNNPIRRIDPNGLWDEEYDDDYRLIGDGHIKMIRRTKDRYDTLTAKDENGRDRRIRVYDKGLLPSLEREGVDGYQGAFAESKSLSDAFNVFYLGARYSDVEWAINGYRTSKGNSYLLSTQFVKSDIIAYSGNYNEMNLVFDMHSHPGINGTKGASGYYNNKLQFGDEAAIVNRYRNFEAAGMSSPYAWFKYENGYTVFPSHYVYHRMSSTLYHYTPWESANYIRHINSGNDLYRNLGF